MPERFPQHRPLDREGRLLRPRFWDRCTLFDVNYVPRGMTVEELPEHLRAHWPTIKAQVAEWR